MGTDLTLAEWLTGIARSDTVKPVAVLDGQ